MLQKDALEVLKSGANVYLTGEPGSGKTHTISKYIEWLRTHGIEPAITASTGIAATHIKGVTIHSWSGIGVKNFLSKSDLDDITSKEHVVKRIARTKVLIIDEVSMLSASVLDMVDTVVREVLQSDKPFAGMQVVLVGDFFQLPPISKREQEAAFAFEAHAWKALNPLVCYLSEQHRQEDAPFLSLLTAIRRGETDESHISLLYTRESDEVGDDVPRLHTHNSDVDRENDEKLEALAGGVKVFHMRAKGAPPLIEALKRSCLSPETLRLKVGATVMATKNNAPVGYVNGSVGVVVSFDSYSGNPLVELRDGTQILFEPVDFEIEEGGKVRASVSQIPLRLAWAITIHKSQGQSMDAAAIDLSRAFEYGQGYVALSRVRTLAGLTLLGWSDGALAIHPKVQSIDSTLRETSEAVQEAFATLALNGERQKMEERFIRACGGTLEILAPQEKKVKKSTIEETLELLREEETLAGVAKKRGLTLGTIIGHVEMLVEEGKVDVRRIKEMCPQKLLEALGSIGEAFDKKGTERLAPVHSLLKGKWSYDELRLARTLLS